jgi:hypothetical protein
MEKSVAGGQSKESHQFGSGKIKMEGVHTRHHNQGDLHHPTVYSAPARSLLNYCEDGCQSIAVTSGVGVLTTHSRSEE